MFDALSEAIAEVVIPVDAAALSEAIALRDRLNAKIGEALVAFENAGLHEREGATSATAWLADRGGQSRRVAARTVTTARRLAALPATAAAARAGTLTAGQVDAIVSALSAMTLTAFASAERDLIPRLSSLDVDGTVRLMRDWQARAIARIAADDPSATVERDDGLHLSPVGGVWRLDGDLEPETGELLNTCLRVAASGDPVGEPARTPAQRRADALADVCRFFLDNQTGRPGGRHRPHVNLIVDPRDPAIGGRTPSGMTLDPETVDRILCDCTLHRAALDAAGAILDYGRATRSIPAPLFNALIVRDEHCRFPGCDRPATWCDGHHVRHWEHGGTTCLSNLVLLCRRHHRVLHHRGWRATLGPDGTFEVADPEGHVRTTSVPRATHHPPLEAVLA